MVEKNDKIDQILSKFEVQNNADNKVVKDKLGKKTKNEFYQVNIWFIINFFLFILSLF